MQQNRTSGSTDAGGTPRIPLHHGYRRFVVGLSMLLVLAGAAGCGEKIEPGTAAQQAKPAVAARVAVAAVSRQPFVYEAVGTVVARTASTLSGKLMGTVKAVNVEEGSLVREGEAMVEIDDRQVSAQLHQAQAALAEARRAEASANSSREAVRARAELARSTYERYLKLIREDSASQQEFDEVVSAKQQAEAALTQTTAMLEAAGYRVQQAKAAVAAARVGSRDAVIRAPYDGRVTAKMVEVGDLASPGTPFLTLEKKGVYCVNLVVPEKHIGAVRLDETVQVSISTLENGSVSGKIGRIVPAADQKTRSFLVKVALPEGTPVQSGMFARVILPVGQAGMILVPSSAIVRRGQLTGVYKVDETQTARFRLIRIGRSIGDAVEVLSGIREGDRFVVAPPVQMENGSRVEVSS